MEQGQTVEKRFFAASNSSHGFQNYYPACFGASNGVERLYIIKGGPGTGKSHLMHTVGEKAAAAGYDVTYYHCSSDPDSLDGIIARRPDRPCFGMVDGTAPHTCEPTLPGAREEIIHLGDFWDSRALAARADEIRSLNEGKSACYAMAYRFLHACGEMDAVTDTLVSTGVDREKIRRLAVRILGGQTDGSTYRATPALLDAVGMTGIVRFDTFERLAGAHPQGTVVYLEDYYGLGYRVMEELLRVAERKRLSLWVAYHPVHTHKTVGVYVPAGGLCVMVKEPPEGADLNAVRRINLRRYADAAMLRSLRADIRHTQALHRELLDGAVHALTMASSYHFALESIYTAAMDLRAKDAYEQAWGSAWLKT